MLNFAAGTSFCAFPDAEDIEVRIIPPALFSFRGAKAVLHRGAVKAARATSVAGFVLFAGLVAYNYAVSYVGAKAAHKFATEIDMQIDAAKADFEQSHAKGLARYEAHVRTHVDPKFDLAAWMADAKQVKPVSVVIATDEPSVPAVIASVRYEFPAQTLVQQPVIDAAHVSKALGAQHPLVAKFKAAEKTCPAVPSNVQLGDGCDKMMRPLYAQFGDAFVAKTHAASVAALNTAKVGATKHVSAPATKLLKIQQPKQDAKVNRPGQRLDRVADVKPHKKKMAAVRPAAERFDAAAFFRNMDRS